MQNAQPNLWIVSIHKMCLICVTRSVRMIHRMVVPLSCRQQAEREAGLQSKRAELSRWEAELGGRQQELEALREECRSLGGEVKGERGRAEELQRQLHEATIQQGVLQQHKEQLQQKLSQVRGHQVTPGQVR